MTQEERYNELASHLTKVDEAKKGFILSLLRDFVFYEDQINQLKKYPRYVVNPSNPRQQKKLPVHEILKDYQAQKNDIATKILRSLDGETTEESPLLKALARYDDKE